MIFVSLLKSRGYAISLVMYLTQSSISHVQTFNAVPHHLHSGPLEESLTSQIACGVPKSLIAATFLGVHPTLRSFDHLACSVGLHQAHETSSCFASALSFTVFCTKMQSMANMVAAAFAEVSSHLTRFELPKNLDSDWQCSSLHSSFIISLWEMNLVAMEQMVYPNKS